MVEKVVVKEVLVEVVVTATLAPDPALRPTFTPSPVPTVPPTSVPVNGLGVSRADIQSVFGSPDIGFEFDPPRVLNDGRPAVMGMSPNGVAILELTGPPDNLTGVDLIIGLPSDSPVALVENSIYLLGVAKLAVPSWPGAGDWIIDNLERTVSAGEVSTTRSGVEIKLSYIQGIGAFTLSIDGRQAISNTVPVHTPTMTLTPTISPTPTVTFTPTVTPTPTNTPTPTSTPTPTNTPTPTPTSTPIPPFVSVSSGSLHTCALRADGAVLCWGDGGTGELSVPEDERFVAISSGKGRTCGLDSDGVMVCWGSTGGYLGEPTPPESKRFISLSTGYDHVCGLDADGVVSCSGREVPQGQLFTSISSGLWDCGLRPDSVAICWGQNGRPSASQQPPANERFISISTGHIHACGLREDGSAVCWGGIREDAPRNERFKAISSGSSHTCGLRADGMTVCWGNDEYGRSSPPENEKFVSISSGGLHTCGLRENGTILCWGYNAYGQTIAPFK